MKQYFGFIAVLMFAIGMMTTSCTKEETWTDADNFLFDSYKELRDGALGGHDKCYSVIFPVTIVFPDSTELEVFDREELITTIKNWKEANPDVDGKPSIQFPISVETSDGDTIVVESRDQAKELRKECRGNKGHKSCKNFNRFLNNKCFQVQLPIALIMEDGEIVEIAKRGDIAKLLKEWKKDRPDEIPELVFPITVTVKETKEDVVINNAEEFEALIEECK